MQNISPRNKKILDLWQTGDHTYESIGKKFDISRERVRQILNKAKNRGFDVKKTSDVSAKRKKNIIKSAFERIDKPKFLNLYEKGFSIEYICNVMNITSNLYKNIEEELINRGLTSRKKRIIRAIKYEIDNPDEITQYRERIIIKMRGQNASLQSIADHLEISKIRLTQIVKYMKLKGVEVPNSRVSGSPLDDEEILARVNTINNYLDEGLTVRKIHNITGYGQHSIATLIYTYLKDV